MEKQLKNPDIRYIEAAANHLTHKISQIINSLDKQAKLDAEVLRAAYAYANFELELQHLGADKPDTAHARDLIGAVQAAKEE